MPIETICKGCARKLRVADEFAGRKARCPHCKAVYTVPGAATTAPRSPPRWRLRAADGSVFGPASRADLDAWLSEGRITAACQLQREDETHWRPAGDVYRHHPHPDDPPLPRIAKLTLAPRSEPKSRSVRDVIIPAGSFAEATLLTGLYAPINDGPQPVQIRIDHSFIGPNKTRIPIQGAFLIGKAVGEANSLRVVIQLDTLSYVRTNGEVIEIPVNGYVADQDGVSGLAGRYVYRIQEAATLAALTGGISAAADAAAQKETTTLVNPLGGVAETVTGDIGRFALARGASRATDEVGRIITERLDDINPAIYIANGKNLTVILLEGITLDGLRPDELGNETSRSPYAGLDLDR